MTDQRPAPRTRLAVILAGGASQRMPGGKANALLAGRTLLAHAVAVVRAADLEAVVVARPSTALPRVGAEIWREPAAAHRPHPLHGIAWALARADQPIVVLPVDLPLLPAAVLRGLAAEPGAGVVSTDGRPAALVARVLPTMAPALHAAADAGRGTLGALIAGGARPVELAAYTSVGAEVALMNVNTPDDLLGAALARRTER